MWTDACRGEEVALQIIITATQKKKKKRQAALHSRRKFLTICKGHSSRYFPKGWKNPPRQAIISFQMITSSVAVSAPLALGFLLLLSATSRVLLPTLAPRLRATESPSPRCRSHCHAVHTAEGRLPHFLPVSPVDVLHCWHGYLCSAVLKQHSCLCWLPVGVC